MLAVRRHSNLESCGRQRQAAARPAQTCNLKVQVRPLHIPGPHSVAQKKPLRLVVSIRALCSGRQDHRQWQACCWSAPTTTNLGCCPRSPLPRQSRATPITSFRIAQAESIRADTTRFSAQVPVQWGRTSVGVPVCTRACPMASARASVRVYPTPQRYLSPTSVLVPVCWFAHALAPA